MLHRVSPSSPVVEDDVELEKKLVRQLDLVVLCFIAEMIIQTKATEKAAVVTIIWIIV